MTHHRLESATGWSTFILMDRYLCFPQDESHDQMLVFVFRVKYAVFICEVWCTHSCPLEWQMWQLWSQDVWSLAIIWSKFQFVQYTLVYNQKESCSWPARNLTSQCLTWQKATGIFTLATGVSQERKVYDMFMTVLCHVTLPSSKVFMTVHPCLFAFMYMQYNYIRAFILADCHISVVLIKISCIITAKKKVFQLDPVTECTCPLQTAWTDIDDVRFIISYKKGLQHLFYLQIKCEWMSSNILIIIFLLWEMDKS